MLAVGQEMIGKFQTSNKHYGRPELVFPHGTVTEVTETGFKVKYPYLKGMEWKYKFSDIGKIVYKNEASAEKDNAEHLDSMQEERRLGLED